MIVILGSKQRNGFTLFEVMITLALLSIVFMGLSGGILSGTKITRDIVEKQLVRARAQIYLNRLMSLNYGKQTDPAPNGAQLNALFNVNGEPGTATLMSLTRFPAGDKGWNFQLATFPVKGQWRITVTTDLNGDGVVSGVLEEGSKLVRIMVFFNDVLMFSTVRGKETQL